MQQPGPRGTWVADLASLLASGVISNSGGKILSTDAATLQAPLGSAVQSPLNNQSYDNTRPKAYLNWVLVDNQFHYVSEGSNAQRVPTITRGS